MFVFQKFLFDTKGIGKMKQLFTLLFIFTCGICTIFSFPNGEIKRLGRSVEPPRHVRIHLIINFFSSKLHCGKQTFSFKIRSEKMF